MEQKSFFRAAESVCKQCYRGGKTAVQLFFATPLAMDTIERRQKKVCSPIEDAIISLAFSAMLGGSILMSLNSKPNMEGVNKPIDYLIAGAPVLSNLAVNIYRNFESHIRPELYDSTPSSNS